MKTKFYMLSIFLGGLLSAQKIEVKASYGTPSLYGIAESFTDTTIGMFGYAFFGDIVVYESKGVFSAEVLLNSENNKLQYGLAYTNETVKDEKHNLKGNFNSILAQANYFWSKPEQKFKMYSGAGVGLLFTNFENNDLRNSNSVFAFNITPFGVRYGEKFGIFLESNIGTKGFAQGGVSYKF